ncbi:cytidine deaminase [Salinisphaera sp. USBA-960]|nr:cytidine deaminase [Salifodinibacter halophilus]NNC26447.1 cytidine deaminase [Salifodinibacter halophilus]
MTVELVDWGRLVAKAIEARNNAYAPYSGFSVGAALWTQDGEVVTGCNVENVSFPCGQCAEANAAGAMVSANRHSTIHAVAIAAVSRHFVWPCGRCRQILAEFADGDTPVMAVAGDQRSAPLSLVELLPHAFATLG